MTAYEFHFTPRETEVADMISHGLSNKEIAESAGISHRTVENHRSQIFRKAHVRNAVELTRLMLGTQI